MKPMNLSDLFSWLRQQVQEPCPKTGHLSFKHLGSRKTASASMASADAVVEKKASHEPCVNEKMGHSSWTASQNSGRQVLFLIV